MLLLHISDIHFKDPFCHDDRDPELYFRKELVTHAAEQIGQLGDVDAILVTGDIAFCGIAAEYTAATKWLETLARAVGCNTRRIYVVPGNHDVNRSVFSTNGGARNAVRAVARAGDNRARERELVQQLTLNDTAKLLFASIADYNLFAAKYDCQSVPGRLSWQETLPIDSRTVLNLHGLNSTITSGIDGNDEKGKLFMSALQLNISRASGAVNLVMAHHPAEWMSDQDDVEMRLIGKPNIVVFGHRHMQFVRRDLNGSIVFSAGSVNPDRRESGWEPAYNLIELTSETRNGNRHVNVAVRQFRWQSNPTGFVAKIDLGDNSPIFAHEMKIAGDDDLCNAEGPSAAEGVLNMQSKDTALKKDSSPLSTPSVRDLVYRFWGLEPAERREIIVELGVEAPPRDAILVTMAYRDALVSLARSDRLEELDTAIARRER